MKIRIKKRLNEGKGPNIIARGLNINLLSDNAKRIFNKFGGFEEVMQGDEETINQVIELITGLSFKDKESLENDLNVFKELARLSEIEVLKHKKNYKEMEEQFIKDYDEMLKAVAAGGGPHSINPAEADDPRNNFFVIRLKNQQERAKERLLAHIKTLQDEVDKYNNITEKFQNTL